MTTPKIVSKVHDMVMGDRRVIERCIASSVGIFQETVLSILTEDLNMRKLSARRVPRLLTVDQRHTRLFLDALWYSYGRLFPKRYFMQLKSQVQI